MTVFDEQRCHRRRYPPLVGAVTMVEADGIHDRTLAGGHTSARPNPVGLDLGRVPPDCMQLGKRRPVERDGAAVAGWVTVEADTEMEAPPCD
ncbi:hypothetical protein [Streptomyces sp. NPDC002671]